MRVADEVLQLASHGTLWVSRGSAKGGGGWVWLECEVSQQPPEYFVL